MRNILQQLKLEEQIKSAEIQLQGRERGQPSDRNQGFTRELADLVRRQLKDMPEEQRRVLARALENEVATTEQIRRVREQVREYGRPNRDLLPEDQRAAHGEIGAVEGHRKQAQSLWEAGKRLTESEHILPKAALQAMTRAGPDHRPDYDDGSYGRSSTVRVDRAMALLKTHMNDLDQGIIGDNARTRQLKEAIEQGGAINYREQIFLESIENALLARDLAQSQVMDEQILRAALEQENELFTTQRVSDARSLNPEGERRRSVPHSGNRMHELGMEVDDIDWEAMSIGEQIDREVEVIEQDLVNELPRLEKEALKRFWGPGDLQSLKQAQEQVEGAAERSAAAVKELQSLVEQPRSLGRVEREAFLSEQLDWLRQKILPEPISRLVVRDAYRRARQARLAELSGRYEARSELAPAVRTHLSETQSMTLPEALGFMETMAYLRHKNDVKDLE